MPRQDTGDLLQGTLGILILKSLVPGSAHGYAIARWIEDAAADVLSIEEGSLYPALRRLEDRDLVSSEWGLSENNRSAKFYTLSRTGRRRLQAGASSWHEFVEAAGRALRATAPVPV